MFRYFGHAGEDHGEAAETRLDIISTIGHLPTVVSLAIVTVILLAVFYGLKLTGMKLPARLLSLVPVTVALGVFYTPHNAILSSIVLSAGFIGIFLLVFTMLAGQKQ